MLVKLGWKEEIPTWQEEMDVGNASEEPEAAIVEDRANDGVTMRGESESDQATKFFEIALGGKCNQRMQQAKASAILCHCWC